MKEKLIQYVELLFAGAGDCEEVKQEILQNTLDRYEDLLAEGKSPEAAYRLAIIGIGDINEVLSLLKSASPAADSSSVRTSVPVSDDDTPRKKLLLAIAIGMYILCPIPILVLGNFPGLEVIGLCGVLAMVAVATVLIILGAKKEASEEVSSPQSPRSELQKSIDQLISALALVLFFIISFATRAWYVTWVIFPMAAAVKGLVKAILDLKEASKHEN